MAENQEAAKQKRLNSLYSASMSRDISFESPNSPEIFQGEWKPQVNLDLNTWNKKLTDTQYEVVVSVTVTAKIGEKQLLSLRYNRLVSS